MNTYLAQGGVGIIRTQEEDIGATSYLTGVAQLVLFTKYCLGYLMKENFMGRVCCIHEK